MSTLEVRTEKPRHISSITGIFSKEIDIVDDVYRRIKEAQEELKSRDKNNPLADLITFYKNGPALSDEFVKRYGKADRNTYDFLMSGYLIAGRRYLNDLNQAISDTF